MKKINKILLILGVTALSIVAIKTGAQAPAQGTYLGNGMYAINGYAVRVTNDGGGRAYGGKYAYCFTLGSTFASGSKSSPTVGNVSKSCGGNHKKCGNKVYAYNYGSVCNFVNCDTGGTVGTSPTTPTTPAQVLTCPTGQHVAGNICVPDVCTPIYVCGGANNNVVVDSKLCSTSSTDCTALRKICSAGVCVDPLSVPVINPALQNPDKTLKGAVSIKNFVVTPNTINPYSVTNPNTTGKCNFVWTLNQYDASSTCAITNASSVNKATYAPPTAISGTYTATSTVSETTYKLTCGEQSSTGITGTSTKYATCYINSSYNEVNQ